MKIPMVLNGEHKILEAEPSEMLMEVLRRENLFSVKCGCSAGVCGSCTVLLDSRAVPSCIIPVAAVRESSVETLEFFSHNPMYRIITDSFVKAGVNMCGYCNAGKIFAACDLIRTHKTPSRDIILETVCHFNCSCTETDMLIKGIQRAALAWEKEVG